MSALEGSFEGDRGETPILTLPWYERRKNVIWAFVGLHVAFLIALSPAIFTGDALGDLPLYRSWAFAGLGLGEWEGISLQWVYPIGALVPIVAAALAGPLLYQLLWFLMTTALNALSIVVLTKDGKANSFRAAWWWMLFLLLMSPVALLRLEGITAPLVVIGLTLVARRPVVASFLLSAAAWIKVWPAAVVLALVTAERRRWTILCGGIALTLAIVVTVYAFGGIRFIDGFIAMQSDRGLQLEAPISSLWLWMADLGVPGAYIWVNTSINAEEVTGPGDSIAAGVMDIAMLGVVLAILALMIWILRTRRQDAGLFLVGSLALVTALVVFNKVGSPQYMLWIAPVVVVGLRFDWRGWRTPAVLLMVIAALTTIVFPILYIPLTEGDMGVAALLTARNGLLVAVLVWAVAQLWAMARAPRVAAESLRLDSALSMSE